MFRYGMVDESNRFKRVNLLETKEHETSHCGSNVLSQCTVSFLLSDCALLHHRRSEVPRHSGRLPLSLVLRCLEVRVNWWCCVVDNSFQACLAVYCLYVRIPWFFECFMHISFVFFINKFAALVSVRCRRVWMELLQSRGKISANLSWVTGVKNHKCWWTSC